MGKEAVNQVQEVQEVYPREGKPKEENSETHRNQTEKIKDKEKYQKQLGKGNSQSSLRNAGGPIQYKPKEKHVKTHINQTSEKKHKGKKH